MYKNHIKVSKIALKYTRLLNRVELNRMSFLVKKIAEKEYYENKGLEFSLRLCEKCARLFVFRSKNRLKRSYRDG